MKPLETESLFLETENASPQGDLNFSFSQGRFPVSRPLKSRFPRMFPKMPSRFPVSPRRATETVSGKRLVGFP